MTQTQELIKAWKLAKLSLSEDEEIQQFSYLWTRGLRSLELHGRMLELCMDAPQTAAKLITQAFQPLEDEMVADFLIHHLAPYMRYLPDEPEFNVPEQHAWKVLTQCQHAPLLSMARHHLSVLPKSADCWKEQVTGDERTQFEMREYAA